MLIFRRKENVNIHVQLRLFISYKRYVTHIAEAYNILGPKVAHTICIIIAMKNYNINILKTNFSTTPIYVRIFTYKNLAYTDVKIKLFKV